MRTLGGNKLLTVAVHAPLFETLARATLGSGFLDDTLADRFCLHDEWSRPRLNRRLLALHDAGFTHPERMSDPVYRRDWDNRVVSAWLSEATAPDPRASVTSSRHAARLAE